jgi:hypothetical protein
MLIRLVLCGRITPIAKQHPLYTTDALCLGGADRAADIQVFGGCRADVLLTDGFGIHARSPLPFRMLDNEGLVIYFTHHNVFRFKNPGWGRLAVSVGSDNNFVLQDIRWDT